MRIAPIAPPADDPELNALLKRAERLGMPDARFTGLLARAPGYAKPLLRALLDSHEHGNVDHRLKEIIRVLLARYAGDAYFSRLRSRRAQTEGLDESRLNAGCDDYLRDPRFNAAERIALEFADQMYRNPDANDAAFYARMKEHYSEAQIMEIGAFIAFQYSMQTFMRAMGAR